MHILKNLQTESAKASMLVCNSSNLVYEPPSHIFRVSVIREIANKACVVTPILLTVAENFKLQGLSCLSFHFTGKKTATGMQSVILYNYF